MKKYRYLSLAGVIPMIFSFGLCLAFTARAADEKMADAKTKSNLSANDKKFVKMAYRGGLTEIENAKVAADKAKNDATKDVAKRMIDDHTKANERLMEIAKEENLDLSKITARSKAITGEDFDKEYLTMLKNVHEKDIAMFEKEANDPGAKEDSDVIKFAKETLPTLKEHLQMVDDALGKMK